MQGARKVMGLDWSYELPPKAIREGFQCRESSCAEFYRGEAERFYTIGAASVITVWKSPKHDEVAGFITISPNGLRGNKYRKAIESVLGPAFSMGDKAFPCWFIGQLARADDPELKGLGSRLLWLAIMDIVERAHHGAGSCIMIEAERRRLVDFYMQFDFLPLHPALEHWKEPTETNQSGKMLLYLPIKQAKDIIQQAGLLDNPPVQTELPL